MGSHSLLQGIFQTQESGSPALQADSLPSEPPGKFTDVKETSVNSKPSDRPDPDILEKLAYQLWFASVAGNFDL